MANVAAIASNPLTKKMATAVSDRKIYAVEGSCLLMWLLLLLHGCCGCLR